MTPIKAPVPTRTVTTRQAPPEFKQPPPPPPLREERKEPQFGQGRTAPGSARDRLCQELCRQLFLGWAMLRRELRVSVPAVGRKSHPRRMSCLRPWRQCRSSWMIWRRRRKRRRTDVGDVRAAIRAGAVDDPEQEAIRAIRREDEQGDLRTPSPPRAQLRGRPPLPRPTSVPETEQKLAEAIRIWRIYPADMWETAGLLTAWKLPVLRTSPEAWNRRVQVGKTPLWSCWTSCTSPRTRDGASRRDAWGGLAPISLGLTVWRSF